MITLRSSKQLKNKPKKQYAVQKVLLKKKLSRNGNRKPFDSYVRNKTKARTGIGPLKKNLWYSCL